MSEVTVEDVYSMALDVVESLDSYLPQRKALEFRNWGSYGISGMKVVKSKKGFMAYASAPYFLLGTEKAVFFTTDNEEINSKNNKDGLFLVDFKANTVYVHVPDVYLWLNLVMNKDAYIVTTKGYVFLLSDGVIYSARNNVSPVTPYYNGSVFKVVGDNLEDVVKFFTAIGTADYDYKQRHSFRYVILPLVYFLYYIKYGTTRVDKALVTRTVLKLFGDRFEKVGEYMYKKLKPLVDSKKVFVLNPSWFV